MVEGQFVALLLCPQQPPTAALDERERHSASGWVRLLGLCLFRDRDYRKPRRLDCFLEETPERGPQQDVEGSPSPAGFEMPITHISEVLGTMLAKGGPPGP